MRARLWVVVALSGCAESGASKFSSTGFDSTSTSDATFSSTDTGASSTSHVDYPAWYAFTLAFDQLADDTWNPATTTLQVDLTTADGSPFCSASVPVDSVAVEPPPADEPEIVEWWSLGLGTPADTGCSGWPGTVGWHVGVGAYDPRLDAAMAADGKSGLDLYGLYFQADDGPVYVLGYAATQDMLDGQLGLPVDAGPLPAGSYVARSVVQLPIGGR